jgi:hypothetical protein
MKGWHFESHRHALAAKGVRTGYFMPFVKRAGVPLIDHPEDFAGDNFAYNKRIVKMKPSEFLRLANRTLSADPAQSKSLEGWKREPWYSQSKVDRIRKGMEEGKNIPALYVEEDPDYFGHEGRHRAIYAWEEGQDIPVIRITKVKTKSDHKKRDVGTTEDLIPGEFEGNKMPEEEQWYARKSVPADTPYEAILQEGLNPDVSRFGFTFGTVDASVAKSYADDEKNIAGNVGGSVLRVKVPRKDLIMRPFPSAHDDVVGIEGTVSPERIRVLRKNELSRKSEKHSVDMMNERDVDDLNKMNEGVAKIHFRRMFPAHKRITAQSFKYPGR